MAWSQQTRTNPSSANGNPRGYTRGYRHPQQATQQAPQGAPAYANNGQQVAPAQAPAPERGNQSETQFVSTKIWKVNAKDKVVDFSSKLTKALPQDFANIHGIGGSDHAANSTICVTICDFTKGTGEKSTTVKYCIDVEDMAVLYHAAMAARLGQLSAAKPQSSPEALIQAAQYVRQELRNLLKVSPYQDGNRPVSFGQIEALGKALSDALSTVEQSSGTAGALPFDYSRQKNNPYSTVKMNGVTYAPVSQVRICFDPTRRYPWTIQISNFEAPIKQQQNGATTHNASQAINKQEAFINLSADDFCAAMVAVDRFVRLWEQRMFRVVDAGCTQYEKAIEDLRNKNRAS